MEMKAIHCANKRLPNMQIKTAHYASNDQLLEENRSFNIYICILQVMCS